MFVGMYRLQSHVHIAEQTFQMRSKITFASRLKIWTYQAAMSHVQHVVAVVRCAAVNITLKKDQLKLTKTFGVFDHWALHFSLYI